MSLTEQQETIMELLKLGKNVFATGPAGTGKSFLIHHILKEFPPDSTQVCSMTGVSTILLNTDVSKGKAKTLHSWSGIGLCSTSGGRNRIIDKVLRNRRCVANWMKTRLLIVDEVSMMSDFVLEVIEEIGRRIHRNSLPFGGMQIIFTGDMFQLPPVGDESCKFCFESPVWANLFQGDYGQSVELTRVFRQENDDAFIQILNEVRMGQISEESVQLLRSRVGLPPPDDLVMTNLFPTKFHVAQLNSVEYKKLNGEEYIFQPVINTKNAKYIEDGRPFDEFDQLQCLAATPEMMEKEIAHLSTGIDILKLKVGAIVMCLVNLDIDQGIVNGSQGRVKEFHLGLPIVEFTNGCVFKMPCYFWQSISLPCISIGQIPLVLSWATTIHKSQGMTLSRANMDLGNQIFECGQIYVALSRVKNLQGLYLSSFTPYKIKANPRVLKFYMSLRN